ncbi:MAG TPA: helix-turn-helix domain-containing protein [Casimicrobiaceae bacterium]
MRAKSQLLAEQLNRSAARRRRRRQITPRLPHSVRRAQILSKAVELFAEYGLTAQTRALADACGVSQRLLYRFFPTKAALIEEVYNAEIVGPFKAVWFAHLGDRSKPVEQRLNQFYREYYAGVLKRRWLRLFLYASLAEVEIAPAYIAAIITRMLELIVEESAHELGLRLPRDRAFRHELGWTLHGAVSHLAIRRHIYHSDNPVPVDEVIAMHVRVFLAGLPAALGVGHNAVELADH